VSAAPSTIVITQSEGAEGSLAASLRARGADLLAIPTVSILPQDDFAPIDSALDGIELFDWIVFTSRHAVEAVCTRPAWESAKSKASPTLRVAAVGKATAASLSRYGVIADLVPDTAGASSLAAILAAGGRQSLQGVRILWPRSDIAGRDLAEALSLAGALLTEPIVYRTVPSAGGDLGEFVRRLEAGTVSAIAFMSPSSARGLCAMLGRDDLTDLGKRAIVASIGPTTSAALREMGAPPEVESSRRTADDLAETLLDYLASHGGIGR
jgi:uroporphyrinogen III methyltransferase/synthase